MIVGLYDAASGDRLPVSGAAVDYVEIQGTE